MTLKDLLYHNRLNSTNDRDLFLNKQKGHIGEIMFDEKFKTDMNDKYEKLARGQGNVGVLKKIEADKALRA